jgi:hypothetical protein
MPPPSHRPRPPFMTTRSIILLLALVLGGCAADSPEEARAKLVKRRERAVRKLQETYVEGREGEWDRIEEYKEARRQHDRELAEAKREAADYARDHAPEIAVDKANQKAAQRDLEKE